jgi:hypothetical protein
MDPFRLVQLGMVAESELFRLVFYRFNRAGSGGAAALPLRFPFFLFLARSRFLMRVLCPISSNWASTS